MYTAVLDFLLKGLWGGMIGGLALQTLLLSIVLYRIDWNKEVCDIMVLNSRTLDVERPRYKITVYATSSAFSMSKCSVVVMRK